jgi:hypothetical protein
VAIHVALFEDLTVRAASPFRSVCRFLAIADDNVPTLVDSVVKPNRRWAHRSGRVAGATRWLGRHGRLGQKLATRLDAANRNDTVSDYPPMGGAIRAELAEMYADDLAHVRQMLGLGLNGWDA